MSKLWQDILSWRTSRRFFYWRLRRLLLEEQVKHRIHQVNAELSSGQIKSMLSRWFIESQGTVNVRRIRIFFLRRGGPKKVSHRQELSLNRRKNRRLGYISGQF